MIRTFRICDIARRLTAVAVVAAAPLLAGESAILANGFSIHADRHEVEGDRVRLFAGDGFTELPSSQIIGFEPDACIPPAPGPVASLPLTPVALPSWAPASNGHIDPKQLAAEAAIRNNLPEALIRSVMHAESGFQPGAISPKGAIGLMQLMPETAHELHADPHDPKQNVEAGTEYLLGLVLKYENQENGVARAVAAYNAGPAAVDRYNGVPPYPETRDYVIRVLTEYKKSLNETQAAAH